MVSGGSSQYLQMRDFQVVCKHLEVVECGVHRGDVVQGNVFGSFDADQLRPYHSTIPPGPNHHGWYQYHLPAPNPHIAGVVDADKRTLVGSKGTFWLLHGFAKSVTRGAMTMAHPVAFSSTSGYER